MTADESNQSALTLEQAHLAVLRGQWSEARRLLEPLVAREPGNAAAQDLFAQVVA